jgi:hypothetical protein
MMATKTCPFFYSENNECNGCSYEKEEIEYDKYNKEHLIWYCSINASDKPHGEEIEIEPFMPWE